MRHVALGLVLAGSLGALTACASTPVGPSLSAGMHKATLAGPGAAVGEIQVQASARGAVLRVSLHDLPPGDHGMHLHVNGSCGPGPNPTGETIAAGAAGGHFDPARTGRHEGPHGGGHLGDLPILVVGADGKASATLTAPRLQDLEALRGRALIIHVGGDNFRDVPAPLGGGGGRLACGVLN